MSFKLLAIRPLKGCNPKFLKNLKPDQVYQFYNDYEFVDGIGHSITDYQKTQKVKVINEVNESVPKDLYGKNINISAIVGKNGSGKSALIELLIATIVKTSLSVDKNFIKPEELYDKGEGELETNQFIKNLEKFKSSISYDLKNLKVEIYYKHKANFAQVNEKNKIITYNAGSGIKLRCIELNGDEITIKDQIGNKVEVFSLNELDDKNPNNQKISQELFYFLEDLFYSTVVNYSHYGFNTNEIGEWIKGVFHKNDGYQLPLVINPFREKGNIDINSEKVLAESRFLVNILQERKLRTIQRNKTITHIKIKLDNSKFKWDDRKNGDLRILNNREEKNEIINLILKKFNIQKNISKNATNFFYSYAIDYLLIKLKKMTYHEIYDDYKKCFTEFDTIEKEGKKINRFKIENNKLFSSYLDSLFLNFSHLTEKFRQALFYITYCYFDIDDINDKEKEKIIAIDELFNWINSSYLLELESAKEKFNSQDDELFKEALISNYGDKFRTHHSLPSFFKIEYYFEKRISNNNFSNLSSGEKQKVFSIHSVIYHIRNLVSVSPFNNVIDEEVDKKLLKLIAYKNINIIFDEIELYAHPDFQRCFIKELLDSLKVINLKQNYLNIIFITHSPFILSDIPKQNVLFLSVDEKSKKSIPKKYNNNNTFGANVHEMLTDGFFIESTKGEFALSKIKEFLSDYKEWKNSDKENAEYINFKNDFVSKLTFYTNLIALIGEDYVRRILENHLDELKVHFGDMTYLDIEEERLNKRLEEIKLLKK